MIVSRKITVLILLLLLVFQGCLPDFSRNDFKSFALYLENNSSKTGCNPDSASVIFSIKNISNSDHEEVRIDVPAGEIKQALIEGTKDETIKIQLLNSVDSSLIIEEDKKIGENVISGGDPLTRRISYCTKDSFQFDGFE